MSQAKDGTLEPELLSTRLRPALAYGMTEQRDRSPLGPCKISPQSLNTAEGLPSVIRPESDILTFAQADSYFSEEPQNILLTEAELDPDQPDIVTKANLDPDAVVPFLVYTAASTESRADLDPDDPDTGDQEGEGRHRYDYISWSDDPATGIVAF